MKNLVSVFQKIRMYTREKKSENFSIFLLKKQQFFPTRKQWTLKL